MRQGQTPRSSNNSSVERSLIGSRVGAGRAVAWLLDLRSEIRLTPPSTIVQLIRSRPSQKPHPPIDGDCLGDLKQF